jgi:hypothetical protein
MAIFIVRAVDIGPAAADHFSDDNGKVYEDAVNRLAEAGLTQGCAPHRFCGDDPISRGEAAAFLSRARNLPASSIDHFVDDDTSIFESGIDKVAAAGITFGCNPPTNTAYCPNDNVTRGQMAAFIMRTLGLRPIIPPPPTSRTTQLLVGAGDVTGCDDAGSETAALLDRLVAQDPDTIVFVAGDLAYGEGTPEQFAQCYHPTWGRHKDRTRPSPGNHEYETPDAAGYFDYFGAAAGTPGQGYYSYQAGGWHVVVLNSNCGDIGGCEAGSPQERWLRQDLASSGAACTLAYWHHPLFSSGTHGGSVSVQPLFRALYQSGAEVVINGHDHDYERFAPQDPSGNLDPVRGVRQFVAGTGGRGIRSFEAVVPNSEARIGVFGVLALRLHAGGYEWEFVPVPGSTSVDVGTGSCH